MRFDVLREPWIPVRDENGAVREVGIYDALTRAHTFHEITSASPMVEYGIYRLLCAFIMDAFRPERVKDLRKMREKGYLDSETIDQYIRQCRDEGVTFDLLDAKRPFLQAAFDDRWDADKNIKPIQEIDYTIPSGNNHVLFDHLDRAGAIPCAEACRQLCAVCTFCTAGLKGPSSVNGAPPLYVMVRGKNLAETLIYSIIPIAGTKLEYANPPVLWRYTEGVIPDKKVASTSLLLGMTFPSRRMTLIPCRDGSGINTLYFQKGLNYQGYEGWTDPHVAYIEREGKRSSLKPQVEKECWRNAGAFLGAETKDKKCEYAKPEIIRQYTELTDESYIRLMTYGAATSNASYLGTVRVNLIYDVRLLDSPVKANMLQDSIELAEHAAVELEKSLRTWAAIQWENASRKKTDYIDSFKWCFAQALDKYYARCYRLFTEMLCDKLAQADINENGSLAKIGEEWSKAVMKIALDEYDACMNTLSTQGRDLIAQSKAGAFLYASLRKLVKEW